MNISDIPDNIYKYYFNINAIEQAYKLQDKIINELIKSNLDKEDLSLLIEYANNFKNICENIINRNKITTSKLYKCALNSLNIINSKAQMILYSKKYNHNIDIMIIQNHYNSIDKYISFYATPEILFAILLFINSFILIGISIGITFLVSDNIYILRLIPILTIILIILPLIFYKPIKRKLKQIFNLLIFKINTFKCQQFLKSAKNIER